MIGTTQPARAALFLTQRGECSPVATETEPHSILTYKYRLLPTKAQHAALARILEDQRILYNAALEECIGCYRRTRRTPTYIDQSNALTECRRDLPDMAVLPLNIQRWTLKRLHDAFAGFFRRVKARDGRAGFPRFRTERRWNSFGFKEFRAIKFDGKRLRFNGLIGSLHIHLYRPLPADADIRSCVLRRVGRRWWVCLHVRVPLAPPQTAISAIGLDVGISSLATLSNGTRIANAEIGRQTARELRRRLRALSRCRRGAKQRAKVRVRLARWQQHIAASRTTYLHQVSARLVHEHGLIAVERLNVKGLASGVLARSIHDAAWSRLIQFLRYKAARAGSQLVEVNAKHTSQECPNCGVIKAKALSERVHSCPCGCVMGRDHAAAVVILRRAVVGPGALNVAGCGERAPGNLIAIRPKTS